MRLNDEFQFNGGRDDNERALPEKLLEPAEFCRLLLSRRQLVRCQSAGSGMLGLLDPRTDEVFQVNVATLDRYTERLEKPGLLDRRFWTTRAGR
jgi:hypothetical protein